MCKRKGKEEEREREKEGKNAGEQHEVCDSRSFQGGGIC